MARNFPILAGEGNLGRYLQEIRKFPLLEANEEFMLAKRWREHGDSEAAHRLVTSHLRLVAKIAMGYRGYGLPISELVSEGNVGMMQAVKRFDPDKGFRLSTYAMWWIRASIQEYILHSWSLVKIGTTAAQKKLFFNLRRAKAQLQVMSDRDLTPEKITKIATDLGVTEDEVVSMNRRLAAPDQSLNAPLRDDGESDLEWQDWLVDDAANQEVQLADGQEFDRRKAMMSEAMKVLNPREKQILIERRLTEDPATLEDLSVKYKVSRERVRQIEARAFEKLQKAVRALSAEQVRAAEAAIAARPRPALPKPGAD
ncbi:MAG: RNA polymerase sigma factor RpoH [Alphaproteobacteria bacterium]|nr:RNA polymerase sigma factor RpoH [Alphaproteobacteria bacterium]